MYKIKTGVWRAYFFSWRSGCADRQKGHPKRYKYLFSTLRGKKIFYFSKYLSFPVPVPLSSRACHHSPAAQRTFFILHWITRSIGNKLLVLVSEMSLFYLHVNIWKCLYLIDECFNGWKCLCFILMSLLNLKYFCLGVELWIDWVILIFSSPQRSGFWCLSRDVCD